MPDTTQCQFCGQATSDPVEGAFCSPGCQRAEQALGRSESAETQQAAAEFAAAGEDEAERAFFHVAGMHGVTGEAFLESVLREREGVHSAEVSYVTESARVEYDPATIEESEICEALSTVGYRAMSREETSGESTATVTAGHGEARALDDLLGFRYVAGVLFGAFIMFPYIVVLYPAQFGLLPFEFFEDGVIEGGGLLLLPLFLGTAGVVVGFTGLPLLRGAYVSLRLRKPNTDLLVTLTLLAAIAYSTVALFAARIDLYFDLAIVVSAVVVAAIFYESLVKQRAVERLTDLTVSQADTARLVLPSGTDSIAVEELQPGDKILVRAGERVPVDGVLAEGGCTVDESVVTGESRPVPKRAGDDVVGGSVVTGDAALVRVGDPPTSSIDRLTTAVWLLQSATHGLQRRTDRLAGVVAPALVGVAVLAGVVSLALGRSPTVSLLAVLGVVVVACPWGLGLATPLSVATNLQAALERGIVVFDETVFDRLTDTDVVVFDKTGTLTTGEMTVAAADAPPEAIEAAGLLERRAAHPAGAAIAAFADAKTGAESPDEDTGDESDRVTEFEGHARGVSGVVDGTECLVGHPDLFAEHGWPVDEETERRVETARQDGQLAVVVGRDGRAEGVVVLDDQPREGWTDLVAALDETGADVAVLTGDDPEAAARFDRPGVDHVFAGIPPTGKTAAVRRLQADGHVTMVGDGTNDAPALAQADLGVALGSGTALASDAADVAIADDDLKTVETTFALARAANRRVKQNAGLALLYNAVAIPAAVVGVLNPVVAMAGVALTGGALAANASRSLLSDR